MTVEKLRKELTHVKALKASRVQYANIILTNISLFPKLLDIIFMVNDTTSCKAAWVFELVCLENISILTPFLNRFTKNLNLIHLDSALRPVAKVCQHIANTYQNKQVNNTNPLLTSKHKNLIIEACFNWLITPNKTATKVYAMETLFLLGDDLGWIHEELILILKQNYQTESAGYKAQAKQILNKIRA